MAAALWVWGCLPRAGGSGGRERVLLCSCGKTIPASEWKPRVLEMELDLQPCKTERGSVPPSLSRRCSAVNALAFGFGFFFPGGI